MSLPGSKTASESERPKLDAHGLPVVEPLPEPKTDDEDERQDTVPAKRMG